MPIYNRNVPTLIVIASVLGTSCATTTHVQHEATPPDTQPAIHARGSTQIIWRTLVTHITQVSLEQFQKKGFARWK
jgi:hypothetical protein